MQRGHVDRAGRAGIVQWFVCAFVVLVLGAQSATAQDAAAVRLHQLVNGLTVTPRVLIIGAHSDDDDPLLIAWLARGHGVETAYLSVTRGEAGDNVGLLLRGIEKTQIRRGMVIVKPGSITPHTDFKGEVYVLSKEEGGRHTPFFNKYRPQFYFRTTDVTGEVELPSGTEMVMPGDNTTLTVKLIQPIAMEKGLKFAIREGGRTVGAGQVTEILK